MRTPLPVIATLLLELLTSAGCPPPVYPQTRVPLETLVAEHNANAEKLERLWAQVHMRVTLSDADGRTFLWGSASSLGRSNGRLMLTKEPDQGLQFAIVGSDVATELFRMGIDADAGLYYCWYNPGKDGKAWYGQTQYAGAPGVKAMPVDPTQLPEILGITELPLPLKDRMPAVVMTLRTDPFAYVVAYLKPQPVTGVLKVWREVCFRWDDKLPRRPFLVRLYDPTGLCRMEAELDRYEPVESDGPKETWPVMPTSIRVTCPAIPNVQEFSRLEMTLSETSAVHPFSRKVFSFWPHLPPGVREPTQVDSQYGAVLPETPTP